MSVILCVDDEEDMLEVIAYNLGRAGHQVLKARSGSAALEILDRTTPDLIVSDVMMPGMDGIELCSRVRGRPELVLTPFLFVTAKNQPDDKYRGLRAGADDYIAKPFELPDLLASVDGRLIHRARVLELDAGVRAVEERWERAEDPDSLRAARSEREHLVNAVRDAGHPDYSPPTAGVERLRARVRRFEERYEALRQLRRTALVGESAAHLEIFEQILVAAAGSEPILVIGETGTGKTATAEAVRALGPRAAKSFRTINCSELASGDPTIATGKLFGYGKNSGLPNLPKEGQAGLLAETDGGVLFMDEIATLPAQAQALLLLPLEGRPYSPAVGVGPQRTVDIKFIVATNRDLAEEVEDARFPRDLYERLAGSTIRLPPLRERHGDVMHLTAHFLEELAREEGARCVVSSDAAGLLAAYRWPGNVRELRRVIRQAYRRAALDQRATIEASDLRELAVEPSMPAAPLAPSPEGFSERERAELAALRACGFRIAEAEARLGYSSRSRTLSHRLRGLSFKALYLARWDSRGAAQLLAGERVELVPLAERRLRSVLDGLTEKKGEPDALLAHLLVEHRQYALAALRELNEGRARRG